MILFSHIENQFLIDNRYFGAIRQQLIKDFAMCGLELEVTESMNFTLFAKKLYMQVYALIEHDFTSFLQLLYRVDIKESKIYSKKEQSTASIAEKATMLILQRTLKKVAYRLNY